MFLLISNIFSPESLIPEGKILSIMIFDESFIITESSISSIVFIFNFLLIYNVGTNNVQLYLL